jgi:nicotinamide mononucleotide adenylyltransferase
VKVDEKSEARAKEQQLMAEAQLQEQQLMAEAQLQDLPSISHAQAHVISHAASYTMRYYTFSIHPCNCACRYSLTGIFPRVCFP